MKTFACVVVCTLLLPSFASAQASNTYRVLATSKTSTMQKEMQDAGAAGFRYAAVMGGETAIGGKEVVVVMQRAGSDVSRYEYRLLATNKTSTMQKEMQDAADVGFSYAGQTVFESLFGGKEVVVILERTPDAANAPRFEYRPARHEQNIDAGERAERRRVIRSGRHDRRKDVGWRHRTRGYYTPAD